PPMFSGNVATLAGATPIALGVGEEHGGVDFRMSPVPTVRVDGQVEGPPGSVAGKYLRLLPAGAEELGEASEAATTISRSDGTFTFANVPPGRYTLWTAPSITEYDGRLNLSNVGGMMTGIPSLAGVVSQRWETISTNGEMGTSEHALTTGSEPAFVSDAVTVD